MLLILGQEADPHISSVVPKLQKRGIDTILVLDLYAPSPISIMLDGNRSLPEIDLIDFIWWRLKPKLSDVGYFPVDHVEGSFFASEWNATFEYYTENIPQERQLSSMLRIWRANNKISQADVATKTGFNTPRTLVTNSSEKAIDFFKEEAIVYKSLTSVAAGKGGFCATTNISLDDIRRSSEEISRCPVLLQQRIDKREEWRVHIFGDQIYAVAKKPKDKNDCGVDWRLLDRDKCTIQPVSVPEEISRMCLSYLTAYSLPHGIFDLAIDKSGEVFFLECNPEGQYMGYEKELGLPLSDAMADLIADRMRS